MPNSVFIALAALIVLAAGCSYNPDPRGVFTGFVCDPIKQGGAYCASRNRPWSQGLEL